MERISVREAENKLVLAGPVLEFIHLRPFGIVVRCSLSSGAHALLARRLAPER